MKPELSALIVAATTVFALGQGPAAALDCASTLGCSTSRVEDTMVNGCDAGTPGEVGIGTLLGDVGQVVSVPVPIVTNTQVDAFTIDLMYPTELLEYHSTTAGDLILDFAFFADSEFPGGVRFGGFGGNATIDPGESGSLATVNFTVLTSGCAEFCFLNLLDHLETYVACGSGVVSAPDGTVVSSTWGRIKSDYR